MSVKRQVAAWSAAIIVFWTVIYPFIRPGLLESMVAQGLGAGIGVVLISLLGLLRKHAPFETFLLIALVMSGTHMWYTVTHLS